jgi:hypothetical protein
MGLIDSLVQRVRRASTEGAGAGPACPPEVRAELTASLTRLDQEISRVRRCDRDFARAHHLYAAVRAYGDVLDEACRVAGVERSEGDDGFRRLMAEVELRSRGWSW